MHIEMWHTLVVIPSGGSKLLYNDFTVETGAQSPQITALTKMVLQEVKL